jgi:hypothetical protein
VSENRVLRRTFGPKMEEVAKGWRRLHNEKLHNLHALSYIIRVIKLRREIGEAYSTRGRDEKCIQNFGRKMKGRDHWEDLDVDRRIY